MSKTKLLYKCSECNATYPKWQGSCDHCSNWNSLVEHVESQSSALPSIVSNDYIDPVVIDQVNIDSQTIYSTGIKELDNVLGKGIVSGSILLLGGEPGIGKSTLSLQLCQGCADQGLKILYVTAEEGMSQIRLRAERIGSLRESMWVYSQSDMETIIRQCDKLQPDLILIDSIQVVHHNDVSGIEGSVSQVRHCANVFIKWIKANNKAGILIGHITKDGQLAGPKVLEHLVDVILYLEGDKQKQYRILRCNKNRFSTTQEIGLFEMKETGLIEVSQPSDLFIESSSSSHPGSVITPIIEGNRVLLVELQALVVKTGYGMAKRTFVGVDSHRANLMTASIDKFLNCNLASRDVFLTIIGGLKVTEPALDLAIIVAIISSLLDQPLPQKVAVLGEVALTGELRSVPKIENRLLELSKMGFQKVIIPEKCKPTPAKDSSLSIVYANDVRTVISTLFNFQKKSS